MKNNKINAIILNDSQTILVSGGSTITRVVKTTLEGVAVTVLSGLIIGEGKNFISDVSLTDEKWEERKTKHGQNAFLDNLKCIGGPVNVVSNAYYKTHNKVVDVARKPWLGKSKED